MGVVYAFACLIPAFFLFCFIPREAPIPFFAALSAWTILMFLSFHSFRKAKGLNFKLILLVAVLIRLIGLIALPPWSDDFFRFMWDGDLLRQGINPYLWKPVDIDENSLVKIHQLNSPEYFTIYPPLAQGFFAFVSGVFPENLLGRIALLRFIYLLVDLGSLFLLYKLLVAWKRPLKLSILFAINPLVIMELNGNLHLETFMIFGLLLSLYGLAYNRSLVFIFGLGLAIHIKLLPIILIPFLILNKHIKSKQAFIALGLAIIPYFFFFIGNHGFANWLSSLSLYSSHFEFNGSIYKILREIGYAVNGYNLIHIIGPALQLIATIIILYFSFSLRKAEAEWAFTVMVIFGWLSFYLLSTTVHPWYLVCLIPFGLLVDFKTPAIWAMLSLLSYIAYSFSPIKEPVWLSLLIYIPLLAGLYLERVRMWELLRLNNKA